MSSQNQSWNNGLIMHFFSYLQSFFSKRSFKNNPLKRTKSVTKLERTKRGSRGGVAGLLESDPLSLGTSARLRSSRSHESLLSSHNMMNTLDLAAGKSSQQQCFMPSKLTNCIVVSAFHHQPLLLPICSLSYLPSNA